MKNLYTLAGLILCIQLMATLTAHSKELKGQQPGQEVTGVVTYPQKIKLPKNAVLSVRIVDVSTSNRAAVVIVQKTGPIPHQVPIPFALIVKSGQIDVRHTYNLQAVITLRGRAIWRNALVNPVITNGNATRYVVLMARVNSHTRR